MDLTLKSSQRSWIDLLQQRSDLAKRENKERTKVSSFGLSPPSLSPPAATQATHRSRNTLQLSLQERLLVLHQPSHGILLLRLRRSESSERSLEPSDSVVEVQTGDVVFGDGGGGGEVYGEEDESEDGVEGCWPAKTNDEEGERRLSERTRENEAERR